MKRIASHRNMRIVAIAILAAVWLAAAPAAFADEVIVVRDTNGHSGSDIGGNELEADHRK